MKVSLFTEIQCTPEASPVNRLDEFLEQAELADRLGYLGYWIAEIHCQPRFSLLSAPYAVLGAASQRTKRLRLGVAVNTLPVHHPVQLAEQAAMLDLLSHGRMDFAAGGGHPHTRVYECFGVEHEKTHEIMEESLKVIQAAWTEDVIKYEGKFFRIPEVIVNPKPMQKPYPPIYIAASSPEGIELAARLGHNLFLPIHTRAREQVVAFAKSYWENLERNGHDLSRREIGVLVPMHLAGTVTEAKKRAQDGIMSYYKTIREMRKNYIEWLTAQGTPLPSRLLKTAIGELTLEQICGEYAVIGDSETAVRELKEISAQTGASHFLAWINVGNAPQKFVLEAMEQCAREVMPQIEAYQPERRSSFSTAQAGS